MSDIYNDYSYKRYKRPFRRRLFPIAVVVLTLGILFFIANLMFGFISFAPGATKVSIPTVTFYVAESESFSSKSDAIEQATIIKSSGGSGYLLVDSGQWVVVREISNKEIVSGKKYTTAQKDLKLACKDHINAVAVLLESFSTTFDRLCEYIEKFEHDVTSQNEIANNARLAYNNLIELANQFENTPGTSNDPTCAQIVVYLTRQLLGLNMVWMEGSSDNFAHVLKNAASWVIFALFDLTNAL